MPLFDIRRVTSENNTYTVHAKNFKKKGWTLATYSQDPAQTEMHLVKNVIINDVGLMNTPGFVKMTPMKADVD